MKSIFSSLFVCIIVAGVARGDVVVYSDSFDNDGLGTNSGVGGGLTNRTISGYSWSENGNLQFNTDATNFQRRALVFSNSTFQSTNGFELTVDYFSSGIGDVTANLLSFGLVRADTNLASYSGNNLFGLGGATGLYSIGANVTNGQGNRGLNYWDGTALTNLDLSGTNQQFVAGANTPVLMRVEADGAGGANWSYEINGVSESSGTIAAFDFASSYRFAAFAQDDGFTRRLNSVSLSSVTAVPEPSSVLLLGLGAAVASGSTSQTL